MELCPWKCVFLKQISCQQVWRKLMTSFAKIVLNFRVYMRKFTQLYIFANFQRFFIVVANMYIENWLKTGRRMWIFFCKCCCHHIFYILHFSSTLFIVGYKKMNFCSEKRDSFLWNQMWAIAQNWNSNGLNRGKKSSSSLWWMKKDLILSG